MKNVRGKWLWWLWLAALPLLAGGDYDYELTLDKTRAYVNEPVVLTFRARQTDPASILYFEFAPEKSRTFEAKLLEERTEETPSGTVATFRYLLFPKRPGRTTIDFTFIVKRTTEARLRHNNTGEPVKARAIDTTDTPEPLPSKTLEVVALPEKVALVGDYRLEASLDTTRTQALSPVYLTLRLKGAGGEPPKRLNLLPKMEGVRVFADEPVVRVRYDEEGAHYDARFSYALMAERDFTVPPVKLKAFSYTRKEPYILETKTFKVAVASAETASLVDKETSPESVYETIASLKRWGLNLFIFACGFVSALLFERFMRARKRKGDGDDFRKEVRAAKDAKTLLNLLVRADPVRYSVWIDDLEKAVYRGVSVNIGRIRKEILKES